MKTSQAASLGAAAGFLTGFAICLLLNIGLTEALMRMLVLTLAGGWIGVLLSWLNQMLPQSPESGSGQNQERTQ